MKVGRDLKAVVEVGHWSLVVVTLVMTLVGWLGLVLVSEPSPEGHGIMELLLCFHWLPLAHGRVEFRRWSWPREARV